MKAGKNEVWKLALALQVASDEYKKAQEESNAQYKEYQSAHQKLSISGENKTLKAKAYDLAKKNLLDAIIPPPGAN